MTSSPRVVQGASSPLSLDSEEDVNPLSEIDEREDRDVGDVLDDETLDVLLEDESVLLRLDVLELDVLMLDTLDVLELLDSLRLSLDVLVLGVERLDRLDVLLEEVDTSD